jgi:signal transduction histidine kinase
MKLKSCSDSNRTRSLKKIFPGSGPLLRSASVLILTDETDFARLLTACWQAEKHAPGITVLGSDLWRDHEPVPHDLVVVGPLRDGKLSGILRSLEPATALILCAPADSRELGQLRGKYPRLVHVPLREDWTQTLLLVAGESLRRTEALRLARQAESKAARNEQYATLGRYMTDMKHSVNNALTSMIGNAELLLLEPGQLSKQSLAQIKTIHSMALRINEIMQRFSSLASEMKDAENASQAETEEAPAAPARRR